MEKLKLPKELNYIKREYTKKLKVIKDNLVEEFNDYIDWNTAEVVILKDDEVTNFYGDVHIQLRTNVSNKLMCEFVSEIQNLLSENKVGLYIQHNFYGDNEDELFFDEEDEIELVFYNNSLQQHCKNYMFDIMFNAYYRKLDHEAFDNILLDGLFD